ncbi:MAG: phosphodiesterase [Rhodospirillales bacterium]
MKFIHLTDTHALGAGRQLYGEDPVARLAAAVDSINGEHGDAAFVILTGDITHWGDPEAYAAFKAEVARLTMPLHLLIGNHDDTAAFSETFPDVPRDADGFVQTTFDTGLGRFLLLDTKAPKGHAGAYCAARRAWLGARLAESSGPLLLFMHHPPFPIGIAALDRIMLQDAEAFHETLAPFKDRIRHLFLGHAHRAFFGNWRGISVSCMRGLNHQVALDLTSGPGRINANFEPPAYGVALLHDDRVVVHLHDFTDSSRRFAL